MNSNVISRVTARGDLAQGPEFTDIPEQHAWIEGDYIFSSSAQETKVRQMVAVKTGVVTEGKLNSPFTQLPLRLRRRHRRVRVLRPGVLRVSATHFCSDLGVGSIPKACQISCAGEWPSCGGEKVEGDRHAEDRRGGRQPEALLQFHSDERPVIGCTRPDGCFLRGRSTSPAGSRRTCPMEPAP